MKKFFISLLTTVLCCFCVAGFTACDDKKQAQTPDSTPNSSVVDEHKHDWLAADIVKEATCVEKGEQEYTCSCGATETREIPTNDAHTLAAVEAKAATCKENGYTAHEACTRTGCEYKVNYQETVGIHDYDAATATCAKGAICSVCKQEVTAPNAHTMKRVEGSPATYETFGWSTFTFCISCATENAVAAYEANEYSVLAQIIKGNDSIKTENFVYYPTLNENDCFVHDLDETKSSYIPGVEATCTQQGRTAGGQCKVCNKTVASVAIPAIGHRPASKATCTRKVVCGVCFVEYGEALGHDIEYHAAKPATCTTDGYDAYELCLREGCNYSTFEYQQATNPDHDFEKTTWTVKAYKAATCTTDGNETYLKCAKCEYIASVEVDENNKPVKEDGYYVGVYELYEVPVLPAFGHTWDTEKANYKEEQLPTCTENGWTFGGTCLTCKKTVTSATIAKLGHDGSRKYTIVTNEYTGLDEVVAVTADMKNENGFLDDSSSKATCMQNAYCGFCGEVEDTQIVDANGEPKHAYKMVAAKSPTCEKEGYAEHYVCLNGCDSLWVKTIEDGKTVYVETSLYELEIDAVGHKLITVAKVEPTCTKKGCEAYEECEYCTYTTYDKSLILDEIEHANYDLDNGETTCAQHVVCDAAWSVWTDTNKNGVEDEGEITWHGCGRYVVSVEEDQKAEHTYSAATGDCVVCGAECTHPSYETIDEMDVCTSCGKKKQ
ncbi:MAG: hypothetical protein IKD47_00185 [Clostridia bacterium]|nr:hypothetical protein [Clostridia bacterium]